MTKIYSQRPRISRPLVRALQPNRLLRPLVLLGAFSGLSVLPAATLRQPVSVTKVHDGLRIQEPQKPTPSTPDEMPDPDAAIADLAAAESKINDNFTYVKKQNFMLLQVATVMGWAVFLLLWLSGRARQKAESLNPPQD